MIGHDGFRIAASCHSLREPYRTPACCTSRSWAGWAICGRGRRRAMHRAIRAVAADEADVARALLVDGADGAEGLEHVLVDVGEVGGGRRGIATATGGKQRRRRQK